MAAFLLLRTFLVAGVSAHYTGSSLPRTTGAAPKATACAPSEPNDRLEVAAAPRAEPKAKVKTPAADPLGLWGLPKSEGPRGPSIFKLNQGRAIDVLRKDYPRFFTAKPDLSIFAKNVELHDNSGKRLAGIKQYERVFDALRFLRRTTMQDAQVGIRLVADDKSVRDARCGARAPLGRRVPPSSSLSSRGVPPLPSRACASVGLRQPSHSSRVASRPLCSLARRSACAGTPSCGCATRRRG